MTGLDLSAAIRWLRESMSTVPALVEAIRRDDLERAAICFDSMAEAETEAYGELSKIVGVTAS